RGKFLVNAADPGRDVAPGVVPASPGRDLFTVFWQCLQFTEGGIPPLHLPYNHWDDARITRLVTLERTLHFDAIGIIRCDEICADQKQNHIGIFQLDADLTCPLLPACDLTVMPRLYQSFFLKQL